MKYYYRYILYSLQFSVNRPAAFTLKTAYPSKMSLSPNYFQFTPSSNLFPKRPLLLK